MNYSKDKVKPSEQINEGKKLDGKFFLRMKRFEKYYQNLALDNTQFESNYKIIKHINELVSEDQMSQNDVWNIIEYFNKNSNEYCHKGSGWFDTRLHLRHLAFVYGIRMKLNGELKLVKE